MERMTLREAAQRTSRSVTTLRRYIRSGRLNAEKRPGRYGPEYLISREDLREAGLDLDVPDRPGAAPPQRLPATTRAPVPARSRFHADAVPLALFQDLQMKHEQLLVQYGMVRAGGLRAMELQSALEARDEEIEGARREIAELRRASREGTGKISRELREAHLELEGRALEIAALKEKVKALEMMTRNAVTTEAIEKQYGHVLEQTRRVDILSERGWPVPRGRADSARKPRDH